MGNGIFAIMHHSRHGKSLNVIPPVFAVTIYHIIYCTLIILLENADVIDVLAYKLLICD